MTTECQFCQMAHVATVPTVHLNGTPAESLYTDLNAAIDALRETERVFHATGPNGRDYYVQDAGAIQRAMEEHERRCADIRRMLSELTEARDHVQNVMDFQSGLRRA